METQPSVAELVVRDITGGNLNDAEVQQIRGWAEEDPAHARMLARFRDAQWRMGEWQVYKDVDKQAVWGRMQLRAAEMSGEMPLPPLKQQDWEGDAVLKKGNPIKDQFIKVWAVVAALIAYHNH